MIKTKYIATVNAHIVGMRMVSRILIGIVKFYQVAISPLFPSTCRYSPTCSQYMIDALKVHGPLVGFKLGIRRFGRCHPWGESGYDPVPPKRKKHGAR